MKEDWDRSWERRGEEGERLTWFDSFGSLKLTIDRAYRGRTSKSKIVRARLTWAFVMNLNRLFSWYRQKESMTWRLSIRGHLDWVSTLVPQEFWLSLGVEKTDSRNLDFQRKRSRDLYVQSYFEKLSSLLSIERTRWFLIIDLNSSPSWVIRIRVRSDPSALTFRSTQPESQKMTTWSRWCMIGVFGTSVKSVSVRDELTISNF